MSPEDGQKAFRSVAPRDGFALRFAAPQTLGCERATQANRLRSGRARERSHGAARVRRDPLRSLVSLLLGTVGAVVSLTIGVAIANERTEHELLTPEGLLVLAPFLAVAVYCCWRSCAPRPGAPRQARGD